MSELATAPIPLTPLAEPGLDARSAPRTAEVAAYLAARMCHDFISPASAIVSGLDLLDDPDAQDMKDEAMALIAGSARKLGDLLAFTRVAFGASATAEVFDARELNRLAQGVFNHLKAELNWQVTAPGLIKPAARAIMNLVQLGGGVLPTGGTVTATVDEVEGRCVVLVRAEGPRIRLKPEITAGLAGEPFGEGLSGHWVQAHFVHLFLSDAGGSVSVESDETFVAFRADIPAGVAG